MPATGGEACWGSAGNQRDPLAANPPRTAVSAVVMASGRLIGQAAIIGLSAVGKVEHAFPLTVRGAVTQEDDVSAMKGVPLAVRDTWAGPNRKETGDASNLAHGACIKLSV